MPGDKRPPKRKPRAPRERIEYADNGLAWLREHLEPVAQSLPPQPEPPGPAGRPGPAWLAAGVGLGRITIGPRTERAMNVAAACTILLACLAALR